MPVSTAVKIENTPSRPTKEAIRIIKQDQDPKVRNQLLRFFNLGVRKPEVSSKVSTSDKIFPTREVKRDIGSNTDIIRIRDQFPPEVQKYFDRWTMSSHDDLMSWKNRYDLWYDMDMVYYNSSIISRSIELVADEVVQMDSHEQPISIEARSDIKKELQEFHDYIGLNNYLRPTAVDIIQYGNGGWILDSEEKGIEGIIPVDIYDFRERMEFSAHRVKQMENSGDRFFQAYRAKVERIDQLIKMMRNDDNIISYFKEYLFGFVVGDYALPPWRFLHFRNPTTKSPFKPFGIPVFIHSIAPYRQFDSAMTLQMAARGARLPVDVYNLKFPNSANPTEKLNRAMEFMSELQNSGINAVNKEETGVGETIVTIEDLFEFSQKISNIDLGKIDDIDLLRDDLIISNFLPRYLLDSKESSFGHSGSSAIQEWKPLARMVNRIQQAMLQQITLLDKIHLMYRGHDPEKIDFILSMPFPEAVTNSDLTNNQKDLLDLCNQMAQSLADKLTDGNVAAIPTEVIKSIYAKFLPYDDKTIYKWVNTTIQNKKDIAPQQDDGQEKDEEAKTKTVLWEKVLKEMKGPRNVSKFIEEFIFNKKQESLREGVINNKHYYSSKNGAVGTDFTIEKLQEIDIKLAKRPVEEKRKEKMAEEVQILKEYKFSFTDEQIEDDEEDENKEERRELHEKVKYLKAGRERRM